MSEAVKEIPQYLEKVLPEMAGNDWQKKSYFGGLFQKLVTVK